MTARVSNYTTGTIAVTNGSAAVVGTNTSWVVGSDFQIVGGDWIVIAGVPYLIQSVNSATSLTLASNYAGSTASGLSYAVWRYSGQPSSRVLGALDQVQTRGASTNPFVSAYVDTGAARLRIGDDGAGNVAFGVGATLAADGALIPALQVNKTTGVVRLPQGRPSFRATKGGTDQTGIAASTATKLTFPTADWNIGSFYDTTNSRWTPPAGRYRISAAAHVTAGLADQQKLLLMLARNGTVNAGGRPYLAAVNASGTGNVSLAGTALIEANGTDYFELYILNDGGTTTVNGLSFLTFFEAEEI